MNRLSGEQRKRQECLAYFVETPVLKRVLEGFYEKYRSFGMACGTVTVHNLSYDDMETIEGLTGRNYHGKKSASLSAGRVQQAIDNSKYAGVLLDELLSEFCKGNLESKKTEQDRKKESFLEFFMEIVQELSGTVGADWLLESLQNHSTEERLLQKRYKEELSAKTADMERLKRDVYLLIEALNHLPVFQNEFEYLPAFAAKYTGDPHYFDEGKSDTLLFYYGINAVMEQHNRISAGMAAEQKHQLLFHAGLLKDSMSNDALVYGIRGFDHDEKEHLGLKGFYEQQEPLSLTLSTIMKLKCVKCNQKRVYAVENPTVFARLIEDKTISAICVNGQPNLAVIQLLDKIQEDGTVIFYNGDFDPEGLLIAERLKARYPKKFLLWHYEDVDYESALSDKIISEKRLKMLDGLTVQELKHIAEKIRETKKAGYQERIFFS